MEKRKFSQDTGNSVDQDEESEMQSAKSEWMDNFASDRQRRSSITREYSPSDDAMKKIKRSWTISTPDNDPIPSIITTGATRNGSHLSYLKGPEQGSYPSLIRTPQLQVQKGYNSEEVVYESPTSPRRVLRQSTLPNPDSTVYYPNNPTLILPVSPNPVISPQYSPYHTDNENDDSENLQPSPTTSRYGVRRQSTLPGLPSELLVQPKYFSTSPNRAYSRSPERPAPFVRQATFPSQGNAGNELLHIPRQLPTSPNRFIKSPDSGEGIVVDPYPKRQMMRQATLPNPDQHHKLLPTSPPRQLSPGYRKVSPEFVRQNTLPNPEPPISSNVVNSLSVHQHGPKFLPISPRAKQAFLFPQPGPTPRPFLSQQHFPIVSDEPQNEVRELQRQHSKMIKVRSHSNEEYSINKQLPPPEGRRMLPEIPPNRSPKLVRQAHVKEELIRANSSTEKRSPVFKTFAETKQPMPPQMVEDYKKNGSATILNTSNYFDPIPVSSDYDEQQINQNYDETGIAGASGISNPFYDDYNNSSNESMKAAGVRSIPQNIRMAENFANDPSSDYYYQQKDGMKPRRRKSRELPIPPDTVMVHGPPEEEPSSRNHRKPETMRSISEDTAVTKNSKPLPRRSMSHPEKDKANDVIGATDVTRKVPTPKPLAEILERQKKAASIRRKIQCKSTDQMDNSSSLSSIKSHHPHNQTLEKQDSSKSFDGVIKKVILNEQLKKIDSQDENKSQSMDERMFVDNSIRKASIATGADGNGENIDGIFKKISVSEKRLNDKSLRGDDNNRDVDDSEHKTTLGEAEIQSAVEAAAVIFKKVVLQKRNAKKQQQADEGEYHRNRKLSLFGGGITIAEETSVVTQHDNDLYGSCGDDYKLVFISSDSSSKEEEFDECSSTTSSVHTGGNSITMDECDWDYFEPGAPVLSSNSTRHQNKIISSCDSPLMYRRGLSESPTIDRSVKGSDNGTDEEPIEAKYIKYDSDDYLYGAKKKRKSCHDSRRDSTCSCGVATTQYVPIPVPVPIIVPLSSGNSEKNQHLLLEDALDTKNMQKAIQQQIYLWNNANTGLLLHQQQHKQYNAHTTQHNNSSKALTISPTLLQRQHDEYEEKKDIQEQPIQQSGTVFRNNDSIVYEHQGLYHTNTDLVTSTGLTVEQSTTLNNNSCCISGYTSNLMKETGEKKYCTIDNDDERYQTIKNLASNVVNETLACAKDMITSDNVNKKGFIIRDRDKIIDNATIEIDKKHLNNHYHHHDKVVNDFCNVRIAVFTDYNNAMTDEREAMQVETIKQKNRDNNSVVSSIHTTGSTSDINLIKHSNCVVSKNCDSVVEQQDNMITISKIMQEQGDGYLVSESIFSSDQESETDSESSLCDSLKAPVQRSYDVISTSLVDNVIEDESTDPSRNVSPIDQRSSDSGTDTDDTGTVVDRRKSKRFTKVFVVNHNEASSDSDTNHLTQTSDSSDDDTSDNDTDIDRDCGIVLNYMKNLSDSDELSQTIENEETASEAVAEIKLNYVKPIDDNDELITDVMMNQYRDCVAANLSTSSSSSLSVDIQTEKQLLISSDADNNDNNNMQRIVASISSDDLHDHSSIEQKITQVVNYLNPSREIDDNNVNHMVMPSSLESFTEKLEIFEDKVIVRTAAIDDEQCKLNVTDDFSIESSMSVDIINDGAATSFMQSSKTESAFNLLVPSTTTATQVGKNNDVDTNTTCMQNNDIYNQAKSKLLRFSVCDRTGNVVHQHTKPGVSNLLTNSHDGDDSEFTCESCKVTTEACNTNTCMNFIQYTDICTKSKQEIQENEGSDTNTITTTVLDTNEQSNVKQVQDNAPQKFNNNLTASNSNNKYKSLVMITQGSRNTGNSSLSGQAQVSIVTSDTTHVVTDHQDDDTVIVRHTNWEPGTPPTPDQANQNTLAGYFTLSLEQNSEHFTRRAVKITSNNITKDDNNSTTTQQNECENISGVANTSTSSKNKNNNENVDSDENKSAIKTTTTSNNNQIMQNNMSSNDNSCSSSTSESKNTSENVTVITGADTLSAVVCLEDGLADDDSWVEEISQDEEEFATTTATDSDLDSSEEMSLMAALDREEELRGYNRVSIDFTLHTIMEESCEESEVESTTNERRKNRMSASELEKYFFYGLAEGHAAPQSLTTREESLSESSSICSEGLDSLGPTEELCSTPKNTETSDLASSRLEKYFLTGFMGFKSENNDSDGSGSVGSDSEGHSSPEQRRKRLVRARGTGRSHSSSLDNLLAKEDNSENSRQSQENLVSESNNSSETDTCDENTLHFEKSEMSYDTAKRKKKIVKKVEPINDESNIVNKKENSEINKSDEDERKTPQPDFLLLPPNLINSRKQTSRDSGFIGSNDDLLKNDEVLKSPELKIELEEIEEEKKSDIKDSSEPNSPLTTKAPLLPPLSRKDSFNNWSSDEETNLMMSKMRQFFKTLVAASANAHHMANSSKSSTPALSETNSPKTGTPVTRLKSRNKPPQLVYFESELTRLMKTVPGIRDDQVREIVEYLSSEDTWSDSYDSSDYTSSDLENGVNNVKKSELQEQISASCQQIISKFDNPSATVGDEEGDIGDGGLLIDEAHGLNKETAFVYQKLVASLSKLSNSSDDKPPSINNSPPLIAKVINHIGSRLVALMHEVSSGESLASSSPRSATRYHRKLQQKISATTTEDDDSTSEGNADKIDDFMNLSRSKSHDLLLGETKVLQLKSSTSDIGGEERGEQSDYERFSWRGSFESALLAPNDSRTKLTTLENTQSPASILAAKRRSAGDLLFNYKSLSREQLDRVRSCGSIGGDDLESTKLWGSNQVQTKPHRRSSMNCDTDESSDDAEARLASRSTLPRSLQHNITPASTNSLPRLSSSSATSSSTNNVQSNSNSMQKSQSVHQILQNNVKSARFRAPGFNRPPSSAPKRAMSAPGLQPMYLQRRDRRNKIQNQSLEEANTSDVASSPLTGARNVAQPADPTSPAGSHTSATSDPWPSQSDDDIDRLVALHQGRHNSLSSLGVRSDSMASVYSGAGEGRYGTVTVKGQIEFGLQYNYKHAALEILVKQCKDLAAVDTKRNRSDPYVKVYLLPDKSKTGKRKTKVKKHTLNPVFDETLRFYMSLSSLESRTLWLTVWHSDMFGRNDFLGEVLMPLQGKVFDNPAPQFYNLQERSEPFDDLPVYKGDIIVGLKFIPPDSGTSTPHSTPKGGSLNLRKFSVKSSSSSSSNSRNTKGSLHILVKEAKNLSAVKASGTCDAFCKSYLLPDKNRSSKQKTSVIKRSTNPVWNHTFIYDDVSLQDLSERALELTIWDHDRLASNEFLGGVRFSMGSGKHNGRYVEWMDATGKELSLWQSMLNRPNFWVEGCLTLRSSLDNARVAT